MLLLLNPIFLEGEKQENNKSMREGAKCCVQEVKMKSERQADRENVCVCVRAHASALDGNK